MATLEVSDIERPALRAREHTLVGDPEKNFHVVTSKLSYEQEFSTTDPHPEDIIGRGAPTPAPKYSSRWFKHNWERMVREEKWPRTFYSLVFLLLLGVWFAIMVAFTYNQRTREAQLRALPHTQLNPSASNLDGYGSIGLSGSLSSFDPGKRSLTVTWSGIYMPENHTDPKDVKPLGDYTDEASWWPYGVAIYRDVEAYPFFYPYSDPKNQTLSGNALLDPPAYEGFDPNNTTDQGIWSYSVDNSSALPIAVIGLRTWDSFDTDIPFTQAKAGSVTREPGFGYPFDLWSGNIVFVATDYIYDKIINRTGSSAIEIGDAQLTDNALNWRFTMVQEDTCSGIENTTSFDRSTFKPTCHIKLDITARRPGLVMFAATVAVIVNWLSTTFIFILTAESIILRRGYMLEGTDLLSVCFTALFALPSVRLLLPGAPDFGALIDLVGIIPNVIIISLCTCIVCVAKLYRSPAHERARAEKLD